MRFFLTIIIIAVLSAVAEYFLPWWTIAIVACGVSMFMRMKGWTSFLAGFLAMGFFWFGAVLFRDIPNNHILSQRMARVFGINDYGVLLSIVSFLGAIIGGLSAWAGALLINPRGVKILTKKAAIKS